MIDAGYRKTKAACGLGMVTSAIVNNFAPLLFSAFQNEYDISVRSISALIAINLPRKALAISHGLCYSVIAL
jgi:hypothetical protein